VAALVVVATKGEGKKKTETDESQRGRGEETPCVLQPTFFLGCDPVRVLCAVLAPTAPNECSTSSLAP
jgi:hypothetical protein